MFIFLGTKIFSLKLKTSTAQSKTPSSSNWNWKYQYELMVVFPVFLKKVIKPPEPTTSLQEHEGPGDSEVPSPGGACQAYDV